MILDKAVNIDLCLYHDDNEKIENYVREIVKSRNISVRELEDEIDKIYN